MTTMSRCAITRVGMSMLEIMIAVAILATALSIMLGTIFTMHQSRASLDEEIKVQAIAQTLVERLQGARWEDLGRDISTYPARNAWSWHRRATKQLVHAAAADFPRPLRDQAAIKEHDLIATGVLNELSGIPGLQVYLEYYQMAVMDQVSQSLRDNPKLDPRRVWTNLVGNPQAGTGPISSDASIYLPEDPTVFDLSALEPAVIMRVLVRWQPSIGGVRWHELVVARRK